MPVNEKEAEGDPETLFQRQIYAKGGISRWYWDYRDSCILKNIPGREGFIIDLGCGEGITTEKVIREQKNCVGYDIIPENIRICREHNIPVILGDISKLAIKSDSIDTILLIEVIEHLEKPEQIVNEIHRVLKNGGRVIIVYPNDFTIKMIRILTGKWQEAKYDPGHVHQWKPRQVCSLLETNGFSIIENFSIPLCFFQISFHGIIVGQKITPKETNG
jgi:2-polyprenyl-3-methyl-5-hydroxy-6-metoxy-1,4-benzoquinol methylase